MKKRALAFFLALFFVLGAAGIAPEKTEASSPTSLSAMVRRAEEIVNYQWTPSRDITVWNPEENDYRGLSYFPGGKKVTGLPYTLFANEMGFVSLKTLEQYKPVANKNYSATAYCTSIGKTRTGPVYGGCCATFLCEVFGGGYMSGDSARYWTVSGIRRSDLSTVKAGVKVADIRAGDGLVRHNSGHIMFIGDVSETDIILYELTPPLARKVSVKKSECTNASGYFIYLEDGEYAVYNAVVRSRQFTDDSASMAPIAPVVSLDKTTVGRTESLTVSWSAVSNAESYRVRIYSGSTLLADRNVGKETSCLLTNLPVGAFSVRVTASNRNGAGVSPAVSFRVVYPKPSPRVTVEDRRVGASWDDTGAEEYKASISDAEGNEVFAAAGEDLTEIETGLSPGSYVLRVTAVYPEGEEKTGEKVFAVSDISASAEKERFLLSENPAFSFAGGKSYTADLAALNGEEETEIFSGLEIDGASLSLDPLPAGDYRLRATGTTAFGTAHAEVFFTVLNESEHDFVGEILVPASCEESGVMRLTCSGCGESFEEEIPAPGHEWTEEGDDLVCARCGSVKKDHAHLYQKEETVESASGVPGYEIWRCGCGKTVLKIETAGKAGSLRSLGRVTDGTGGEKDEDALYATGDLLKGTEDGKEFSRLLALKGDADSDGKISALDYVRIKNHIMETRLITSEAEKLAADANSDGKISSLDYVRVKNAIMGR